MYSHALHVSSLSSLVRKVPVQKEVRIVLSWLIDFKGSLCEKAW